MSKRAPEEDNEGDVKIEDERAAYKSVYVSARDLERVKSRQRCAAWLFSSS